MQFIDLKAQQRLVREKIDIRIKKVLDHGKYIMGPEVEELEDRLSNYANVKHCISCSSGTDALLIPLMAMKIGPGDAVLTTPFTYIATVEVISLVGATPIFCDIYDKTFNINPEELQKAYNFAISKNLNPKAIMPVDLFGLPARYRLIEKIARKFDLFLLQDTAQGFGGSIRGKKCGTFGDVAATSFFPAKPLGCYGDGGAIFTDDEELLLKMKSIRVHGSGVDKYENVRIGLNGRLDTFQAAILLEKLSIFDEELQQRNKAAKFYSEHINIKFKKPHIPKEYFSSWAQYSLLTTSEQERFKIMSRLKENNIPSMIYYKLPLHMQKVFDDLKYSKGDFLFSEEVSSKIFSIPMHPYLSEDQQEKIIEVLNNE